MLRRKSPKRLAFSNVDRLVFAGLYRVAPEVLDALKILKPQTVIRWHRAGFRAYWRWKSRPHSGRPKTPEDIRQLIRDMSVANPLWGAPRIHGELLKLGIDVGQTTVAKYMMRRRQPPSQGWKTFVRNHADGIASMDLFVVPTISFRLLYGFLILQHSRRELLWVGVTAHPSAEWIAHQLTEAYGWQQAPRYIVRDRDCVYGNAFIRRLRAMGIRDRPTAPRSPWQNGCAERLIGSIRRDCLDHDGDTNFGVISLAAPKAASSRVARYALTARLAVFGSPVFFHSDPGIERCLLASAAIRLASTANPSPPTSPAAIHASTTRSKTRRKMSLPRNRSLRARENAE